MFWKKDETGARRLRSHNGSRSSTEPTRPETSPPTDRPGRAVSAVTAAEPGSFRDRDSRVVIADDAIYRALSPEGAEDWRALAGSPLLDQLIAAGRADRHPRSRCFGARARARTCSRPGSRWSSSTSGSPSSPTPTSGPSACCRTRPLLQLELGIAAIDDGLTLKDATPYNVQYQGSQPGLHRRRLLREDPREGEPWVGYRQFCMLYLYPLLFQAHKDIPFQPWMRGSIDGIQPIDAIKVFSLRDRLRARRLHSHLALTRASTARAHKSGPGERRARAKKTRQVKPEADPGPTSSDASA